MPMLIWMAAWTSVWGTAVACCNPEWYGPVPPTFPSKDPHLLRLDAAARGSVHIVTAAP